MYSNCIFSDVGYKIIINLRFGPPLIVLNTDIRVIVTSGNRITVTTFGVEGIRGVPRHQKGDLRAGDRKS